MKNKKVDEFEKAKEDIKKIGAFACCLIAVLLIISLFIDPNKSYAADFLEEVPAQFTSKISEASQNGHQTLIKDETLNNKITLPKEFSGVTESGNHISYIYCMDRRLAMTGNLVYTKDKSVKESVAIAPDTNAKNPQGEETTTYPGLIYILQNHDNLGGSPEENYYYTQIAVWWYVDRANGLDDDKNYDKLTGAVSQITETDYNSKYGTYEGQVDESEYLFLNNLSVLDKKMLSQNAEGTKIKALVDEATNHAKDYLVEKQEKNIVIDTKDISMKIVGDYIETDLIKVTSTNTAFESYEVGIDTEVIGYEIVDENNRLLNTTEILNGQSFKVRVPIENIKDKTLKAKIYVTGYFKDWYDAYIYNPSRTSVQRALLGEVEKQTLTVSTDIEPKIIETKDTALSATVVYVAGGLIVAFGIILIVVAMRPNNAKKNK